MMNLKARCVGSIDEARFTDRAVKDLADLALATSGDKAPSGSRWTYEIKFDGYAYKSISRRKVKVSMRRNDWTSRFRKIGTEFALSGSPTVNGRAAAWAQSLIDMFVVEAVAYDHHL